MADPRDKTITYPGGPVNNPKFQEAYSGLNNVSEYMASGVPFSEEVVAPSGSAASVRFPFVTSELYLKNLGSSSMYVGWTENGVLGTNRYTLAAGEQATFRIRIRDLYCTSDSGDTLGVTAALTTIPGRYYPTLTGSLADPNTGMPMHITGTLTPPNGWGYNGLG